MHTFKDNQGRQWTVEITVAALKRVKALTGVDLAGILEGGVLERLAIDPVLLGDVLYAICKPQADAGNVSDEDFGSALAGDAIEKATDALLEGLVDFFPSARREILKILLKKVREGEQGVLERARKVVEELDVQKTLEQELNDGTPPLSGD